LISGIYFKSVGNILTCIKTRGIKTLHYNQSSIHYQCYGTGTPVVCFHGFGLNHSHFSHLAEVVPDHCFIAFDLPYHGSTDWKEGNYCFPEQWKDIILSCPEIGDNPFILLGYSIGGRLALTLLPYFAERIIRVILLAPDGLYMHPAYWFATQTKLGNNILKKVTRNPTSFLRVIHFAEKTTLFPKSTLKFSKSVLGNDQLREVLYKAWTGFRHFKPQLSDIIKKINQFKIPIIMVYGKYDTTINMAPGKAFHQKITSSRWVVLETGHQLLHVKNASYLVDLFK
jgi:pimeloyl-ACP methyl ester carboxylesterase